MYSLKMLAFPVMLMILLGPHGGLVVVTSANLDWVVPLGRDLEMRSCRMSPAVELMGLVHVVVGGG